MSVGLSTIAGAFSKNKTKKEEFVKSPDVQKAVISDINRQQRFGDQNEADINYSSGIYRNLYSQQAPQAAEGSRALYNLGNRIAGQVGTNDPLSYYRQMGDYATGKIGDFANKAIGAVPLSLKLMSPGGYSSPGGSYRDRLVSNNVFSRTIPYVSQLLSNIGSQAGSLYGAESARINQIPGLYSQASEIPFQTTRYLNAPMEMRNRAGMGGAQLLALLQQVEDANNIRGLRSDPNWAGRLGQGIQAGMDNLAQHASIFNDVASGIGNIAGGAAGAFI